MKHVLSLSKKFSVWLGAPQTCLPSSQIATTIGETFSNRGNFFDGF